MIDHGSSVPPRVAREEIVAVVPRLRRFCLALTHSPDVADDLAQSTIERALARLDQWQQRARLDSWMFTIAKNLYFDELRAAKRRGSQIDVTLLAETTGDDGRQVTEQRSDLDHARRAIAVLPAEQRALVALVVIDGRSYKDAAAILDIPIGTVMSRLARARQAIDRQINGEPHALSSS